MSPNALEERSASLFAAVGGWRTVAESVASRVVFLVAYLLTAHVVASALIAAGAVTVLVLARLRVDRRPWSAIFALATVAVSALLAGTGGQPADFYLPRVALQPLLAAVVAVSMLAGRPVVGIAVEALRRRGDRRGAGRAWHHDADRRRRYQRCSAVFLAKDVLTTAVVVPLYLAGALLPLGVALIVLGGPLSAVACLWLCRRILHEPGTDATAATAAATATDRAVPA